MGEELVSVCIPAYNSGRFIVRTIESILNQTYKNIEIVVVDDCSSDDTVDKVKNIKDDRIKLIVNESNLGMSRNWDKCIRSCTGRYVKLIPADDCIYPDCISRSVVILEKHPEVSLVVVGTDLVDNDDKITGSYMHWPGNGIVKGARIAKTSVMLNNFWGNPVCALFRKEDYIATGGFDDDIPYILDFDLWLGLSRLGDTAVIKDKLSSFRVRKDSNTGVLIGSKGRDYTAEHVRLLDKHIAAHTFKMNGFERWISITWRRLRNYLIALFIKIKA
ncbi:MAG: glycosyltransferase [Lachnospiraceae bacterium]|nr:glycosyltransferase [Lachnospiraceae bacterium]